jgi:hypothetical protein
MGSYGSSEKCGSLAWDARTNRIHGYLTMPKNPTVPRGSVRTNRLPGSTALPWGCLAFDPMWPAVRLCELCCVQVQQQFRSWSRIAYWNAELLASRLGYRRHCLRRNAVARIRYNGLRAGDPYNAKTKVAETDYRNIFTCHGNRLFWIRRAQ